MGKTRVVGKARLVVKENGFVKRTVRNIGFAIFASLWLGACGAYTTGSLFDPSFWQQNPISKNLNSYADLGLAAMGKGNYGEAEAQFGSALKANPQDVHALLGMAVLYQHTSRPIKAREMYRAVLAANPPQTEQSVVWNNFTTRSVADIANVNLAVLEGRDGGAMPQKTAMNAMAPVNNPMPAPLAMPMTSAMPANASGQNIQALPLATGGGLSAGTVQATSMLDNSDANIASRFKTLKRLRIQGLITQREYNIRRQANIGALLPLTSPPPAASLDRPVPSSERISERLRAIGRALEMRALSVDQHASERSMILDALMPAAPRVVANPAGPPQGLMEAADSVRRLEQLRAIGLISSDEYTRERSYVETSMRPAPEKGMVGGEVETKKAEKPKGPQSAIHLASYRSRKAADRGWTQLRRAHKDALEGLEHEVSKVDLGPGKGIYYRLKAGPLGDKEAAASLCRKLKSRRQYCQPSMMKAG